MNGKTYGVINPYDILADVCYPATLAKTVRFPNPTIDRIKEGLELAKELRHKRDVPEQPPCIGDWVTDYLNVRLILIFLLLFTCMIATICSVSHPR